MVAAIAKDAPAAGDLLPIALENLKKGPGDEAGKAEGERVMRALAALAGGKPAEAAALVEPVTFDAAHSDVVSLWSIARMQAGDWASAAKGLAFMNSREARGGLSSAVAFSYAALARAQVKLGQIDEARKNYQKFFDLFKDADPDLPLLIEARDEVAKLGS